MKLEVTVGAALISLVVAGGMSKSPAEVTAVLALSLNRSGSRPREEMQSWWHAAGMQPCRQLDCFSEQGGLRNWCHQKHLRNGPT